MVDVADYTNESTRDHEMRQIITDVQVFNSKTRIFTIIAKHFLYVTGEHI